MHEVVVYSRRGCHLCDVVKETLKCLEGRADFQWREVDIDADEELLRLYNESVPVVFIDGRKSFKYQMSEQDFLKRLGRSLA
jgi:glutaredoxin